ncbi:MAG: hypothetical protein LBR88_01270 [Zoogloeaceae bacterium]|jgi:hypothetical protein|nr:hypothetical protein [Zoogloeaceae bacterium]
MNASAHPPKIKFKGSTAPVIVITANTLDADALRLAADEHFGDKGFFDNDVGILNLAEIPPEACPPAPNWPAIAAAFSRHGLKLIGIRAAPRI